MNEKEAKSLVNQFRQAAYESGYYSGRKEDGQAHHLAAMEERDRLGRQIIAALTADAEPETPKVMTRQELEGAVHIIAWEEPGDTVVAQDAILAHDARLRELLRRHVRAIYLTDAEEAEIEQIIQEHS